MKFLPASFILFAAASTIPAIGQSSTKSNLVSPTAGATVASTSTASAPATPTTTPSATTVAKPAETAAPALNAGAIRSDIARQDKVIKNQIDAQQSLLKKNQELAKEAAKLDEKNRKLAD